MGDDRGEQEADTGGDAPPDMHTSEGDEVSEDDDEWWWWWWW